MRLMPEALPYGTYTRWLPERAMLLVSRAPLLPTGSLVTCTITESPDFSACSIERALPSRPLTSQLTSPA